MTRDAAHAVRCVFGADRGLEEAKDAPVDVGEGTKTTKRKGRPGRVP